MDDVTMSCDHTRGVLGDEAELLMPDALKHPLLWPCK